MYFKSCNTERLCKEALQLFADGVLVLDEVDSILHPLKSELNFPIGEKHPLDFSPERWTCAIHALDAVFYVERKSMSVPFHQSGRAHRILEQLKAVIEDGYERRALQRSPHLVLLNSEWFHCEMRPIMARWMLFWLDANQVSGIPTEHRLAYLNSNGASLVGTVWSAEVEAAAAEREAAEAAATQEAAPSAAAAEVEVRSRHSQARNRKVVLLLKS